MAAGPNSQELFNRACQVTPGGVNSPVRAFKQVGGNPLFIERGEGAYLFDVDGRKYIDYVGSWGPLILGHAPSLIQEAIVRALERGTSFGAPTEAEVVFAELLTSIIPSMEMVRFVNSGTEATMSAVRLARAVTGREVILKCNGCYHGHADFFLVKAGSGVATCGIAGSPGVPEAIASLTLSVEFNDLELIESTLLKTGPERVAAIIVEPVPGNMGLVLPQPGYLQGLRSFCSKHGIILIFDEVMSGFRVALGGAQEYFGVTPDLSTFGKVIGGGLPVGAFGGRRDLMSQMAPSGPVYQAGTLSGNPLAMAAGMAMLQYLKDENPYPELAEQSRRWEIGLKTVADKVGIALQTSSIGSMVGLFFADAPVMNFTEAAESNIDLFVRFFQLMLEEGVYLAPSAYEAGFLSTMHTAAVIDETVAAAERVFAKLR